MFIIHDDADWTCGNLQVRAILANSEIFVGIFISGLAESTTIYMYNNATEWNVYRTSAYKDNDLPAAIIGSQHEKSKA